MVSNHLPMRPIAILPAFLSLLAASGCAPAPAPRVLPPLAPAAPAPEPASGGDAAPAPLTLGRCLALAEGRSERLGTALQAVRLAEAQRTLARSGALPHLAANASHFRQQDGATGSGSSAPLSRRSETRLTLDQPLFQGFRDVYATRSAGLLAESARLDQEDILRALRLAVCDAYAGVLAAEASIAAVDTSLARARDRVAELRARLEVGLVRRADVLSAEAQEARQEAQRVETAGERASARAYLAFFIGREIPAAEALVALPPLPEPPPGEDAAGLVPRAQAHRMDLAALDRKAQAAEEAVGAEKARRWPSVGFNGNL